MDEQRNDIIEGRNAVQEALRAGRAIDKIYIARGETDRALGHIAGLARDRGITVSDCDRRKLDAMSVTHAHQGVIAVCAVREYASIDDIFNVAAERGEQPFVVVCDEISDPHNLGAIIRTAEAAGAHGVIIPKRRGVGLTATVAKTSAGAVEYMPVVRVPNIVSTIEELKQKGLWIFCADMDGQPWCSTDMGGPIGIVVGAEGSGVSRLTKEHCDFVVSLPMNGQVNSLNASVAAAIVIYEAVRQRSGLPSFVKKN